MQPQLFVSRASLSLTPLLEAGDGEKDPTSESQLSDSQSQSQSQSQSLSQSVDEAIRLLELYTKRGDPLMTLQHYYQQRKYLEGMSNCWLPPQWYRIGRKKETKTYWSCTFQCPLDQSASGTSVVASPLLRRTDTDTDNIDSETSNLRNLARLSQQWFGDFVVNNDVVYFGTKKNAKRSAAFCFLWKRFGPQGIPEDQLIMTKSKRKKDAFFRESQTTNTVTTSATAATAPQMNIEKKIKKLDKIPWIHEVYRLGIRKLHIVYRTQKSPDFAGSLSHTMLSPTLVVCEIEIRTPATIKVQSDPMPTKSEARNKAISKLASRLQETEKEKEKDSDSDSDSDKDKDSDSDSDKDKDKTPNIFCELEEKMELLASDPPYLHCAFELPHWACWNASKISNIRSNGKAILYKVDVPFVTTGSLGLLLPDCEELRGRDKDNHPREFQASFRLGNGETDYTVKLCKPHLITLDNGNDNDNDNVASKLEDFFTITTHWKLYGTNCPLEALKSKGDKRRHYTFVPLVETSSLQHENKIDWDLIERVVQFKTTARSNPQGDKTCESRDSGLDPMPRDFLFAVGAAESYMLSLETVITNYSKAQQLKQAASALGSSVFSRDLVLVGDLRGVGQEVTTTDTFTDLLSEATTVFPTSRFERLEFLGDRVLNHAISLNLFARNCQLQWGHDELKDHGTVAKKNVALVDCALRAGLDRLIHAGIIPWKKDWASFAIPDTFLCNIVESILGAAYLHEQDEIRDVGVGQIVVGILEGLKPPIPTDQNTAPRCGGSWFRHCSLCLGKGYDFGLHPEWQERLHEANTVFDVLLPTIKETLGIKSRQLLSILSNLPKVEETGSLLLSIALFDANLDGSDKALPDSQDILERLGVIGMIRDNLFHVGSTALELHMSRDLFALNPSATPSDLHLLLACALTHDVLVYILLKRGLHECLFDDNPPGRGRVMQIVLAADAIGHKHWESNAGWILPGGSATFHARRQQLLSLNPVLACEECAGPTYPGVAGGRLYGNDKKLNMTTVDDWQFSFKCIVGGLVLSVGSETTWNNAIRPLMEEVMILTPEEYRLHFSDVSTVCANYSTGNTNCLRKTTT